MLRPPTDRSLSEWAEEFAYLSPENSSSPGKWRNIAYQVGIMDAITDPLVEQITVMKSARVGYTKILDHAIAYFIHQDPSPILIVQPTIEDAQGYSKDEIDPMIRDTPVLTNIFGDYKEKDSGQTITVKSFPGGKLYFVGANSPRGFRRITVRIAAFDEVDGYPLMAGDEGDQITLGIRRTQTYWNRKILLGSTPTLESTSRIKRNFKLGDQRYYHVPCPECGESQKLEFANLKWPDDEPAKAVFFCVHCGAAMEERHKKDMIAKGQWIADAPFHGHASFHIWSAYSLFPNAAWGKLAQEFLDAKGDKFTLQVFVNTVLGQTWEEEGVTLDEHSLAQRRETYAADCPEGVLVLTAGVDVQDNRLEVEVKGWGMGEECWGITYRTLRGDPSEPDVWQMLDDLLAEQFEHESGVTLPIMAACIDSGGHHTQMVYDFCKTRQHRRVYAVKGMAGEGRAVADRPSAKRTGKSQRAVDLFTVGVDVVKSLLFARLPKEPPGFGSLHFPSDYDDEYFAQLTAEKRITRYSKGFARGEWVKTRPRNEALDVNVYAYAALKILNPNFEAMASRMPARGVKVSPQAMAMPTRGRRIISGGIGL